MSVAVKNSVTVELYDNVLTERTDDRFGHVVTTKSMNVTDLISIAVSRRTDLSPSTMKSVMEILTDIAIEQIANGASVNFGLGYFNLGVSGVFIGDNAKWDSSQHKLWVKAAPTAQLRNSVASCSVDVRGMAVVGICINLLVDVSTGEENARLTPGGGVNLTGSKIKIDGDDPNVGIKLINQANDEITLIPKTSLLVNEPSRITFIVPPALANGDYKLSLTTQYSPSIKTLKEARTSTFDYVLNVTK